MKPGPRDHRHRLKIAGDELQELKRHIGAMAESFGLDRKIEKYQGTRPITLYRWDLDCLLDVIAFALKDEREYPNQSSAGYLALKARRGGWHGEASAVAAWHRPAAGVARRPVPCPATGRWQLIAPRLSAIRVSPL